MPDTTQPFTDPSTATREGERNPRLTEDVRLLGQLLGDVVREQEGEAVFELIEAIRRLSVAVERHEDAAAGQEMDALLKRLGPDETVSVIRAFSRALSGSTVRAKRALASVYSWPK